MGELIADGNTIDLNGTPLTDVNDLGSVRYGETRGRQAITVTLRDGSELGTMRLTDVDVVDGGGMVSGQIYQYADPDFAKSGWNWNLVVNDGSLGVHNPFFARGALIAARDALSAVRVRSAQSQKNRDVYPLERTSGKSGVIPLRR